MVLDRIRDCQQRKREKGKEKETERERKIENSMATKLQISICCNNAAVFEAVNDFLRIEAPLCMFTVCFLYFFGFTSTLSLCIKLLLSLSDSFNFFSGFLMM